MNTYAVGSQFSRSSLFGFVSLLKCYFFDRFFEIHRKRNVARVFDELSDELCRVADMAEFIRLAHPDNKTAQAAEKACISISGLVERLNTDVTLFEALRSSVENPFTTLPTDDVDNHVAKLFLLDFYQCGIHLPDEDRQKVVDLNDSILQLGQQFSFECHQPRRVNKMDLPNHIRHHFTNEGFNVILNGIDRYFLLIVIFFSKFTHQSNTCQIIGLPVDTPFDQTREAGYKVYYWEDSSQEERLMKMVELRHDLATMCEYETFAHRAMSDSLGESPLKVNTFLEHLSKVILIDD